MNHPSPKIDFFLFLLVPLTSLCFEAFYYDGFSKRVVYAGYFRHSLDSAALGNTISYDSIL